MRSIDTEASFFLSRIESSQNEKDRKRNVREFSDWLKWLRTKNLVSNKEEKMFLEKVKNDDLRSLYMTRSYGIKNYIIFTFSLLALSLLVVILFILFRNSIIKKTPTSDISEKVLPFSGSLVDSAGTPINYSVDVTFKLYADKSTSDYLYVGVCAGEDAISPDFNGSFTIALGRDCGMSPIPEKLFVDFPVVYLGVTIANGNELSPRYLINTYTYLNPQPEEGNSSTSSLFGMDPQTNEVILKAESPTIKSLAGQLSIEGESLLLKSTGTEYGDIWIEPSLNNSTIFPIGRVGIGVFKPEQKLTVVGAEPFSSLVSFLNTTHASNDQPHLLDLKLGMPGSSSQGSFIRFFAESTMEKTGTLVGSIKLNKGGVVYETKGADFAEYFETDQVWPVGTAMSVSERGLSRARSNEPIVGVVSRGAGFVGNSSENRSSKTVLVGMVGQVDVFVSTEKGQITKGDLLQVGVVPGLGVKGTDSGPRIGYVLDTPQANQFSNSQCPLEFRGLFDPAGELIRCGIVRAVLQTH